MHAKPCFNPSLPARRGGILKVLLLLIVVLILLVIGGVVAAFMYVDTLARKGIEKGGTYALGVPTTLDKADVGILSGTFEMSGLKVADPPGFPAPHFLTLGNGGVEVDLNSLQKPVVELKTLNLSDIDVRLEKKSSGSNYQVILDNLKKLSGDKGSTPPSEPAPKPQPQPAPSGDEKKFVIRELLIKNIVVHVDMLDAPAPVSEFAKIKVPIEEIKLTNVGGGGGDTSGSVNGVTLEKLTSIVVQAVLKAAMEKGGGVIPGEILGDIQGQLANLGDLQNIPVQVVGDVAKKAEDAVKKVGEQAEKAVGDVGKKIEGLLGGGEKKPSDPKKPDPK